MIKRFFPLTLVATFIAAAGWTACKSGPKEQKAEEKPAPLAVSQLSAPFTQSFTQLINSYFELSDALVAGDTVKVNAAAASLMLNSQNLKIAEIEGDSSGTIKETAKYFANTITGSAQATAGEKSLEGKRHEFNVITDALWSLTRTVRYDGEKVYYHFCPMAFDNAGAYWLSRSREIRNPYYGDKMLNCGEVTDSLDYSKR